MRRYLLAYVFVLGVLMASCGGCGNKLGGSAGSDCTERIGMSRKGGVCSSLENMVYHG